MQETFEPYEGCEKYVFVSYSHADRDVIIPVLERLHNEGVRIWYDAGIEWGAEWCEEIAEHLRGCEVCMLFHSSTSIISPNCRQEVDYAFKNRKKILSVFLEDVELSAGKEMQLLSIQAVFLNKYDWEQFLERLVNADILQNCKSNIEKQNRLSEEKLSDITGGRMFEQEKKTGINFDKVLEGKFKEIFDLPSEVEEAPSIRERIIDIKRERFVDAFEKGIKEDELGEGEIWNSLIPLEYLCEESDELIVGKHIVIPRILGYNTLLFMVQKKVDSKTFTKYYTCEPVLAALLEEDEKIVYFFTELNEEENRIILLHFNSENKNAFVNTGILYEDALKISKKPMWIELETWHFEEQQHFNPLLYDLSNFTEEEIARIGIEQTDKGEQWLEAEIGGNLGIVIDPETAFPVQRELYYDDDNNKWKAKIKIIPNKRYFVFQIRDEDTNSARVALTNMEIARYYRDGLFSFPKDVIKAAEYFEKDGSADSLYELAVLFRTEKSIYDEDMYLDYLHKSIEMGSEKALLEQSLMGLFSACKNNGNQYRRNVQQIKDNNGLANFIMGYFTEKGIIEEEQKSSFEYYYKAAIAEYKPALARIGVGKEIEPIEIIKNRFTENLKNNDSMEDYCMGCILFFGLGLEPYKEKGVELLVIAARKGNKLAVEALELIFEKLGYIEEKLSN